MAISLATAYIQLVPSSRGIADQIAKELGAPVSKAAQQAANEASRTIASGFSKGMGKAGQVIAQTGSELTHALSGAAVAAGLLGAGAVRSSIQFESAFAAVTKTVDGTVVQLDNLRAGIIAMANEIPATREEIAGVAAAAGQLGVETDNILAFTRTMIDLGEATNLTSEQAAEALARFANITQLPQDQFDELGSTIVALGNNMATTEAEITEMGLRIAGAGAQVGLTEAEILSFSAALSSVGIEAQAGGSAISRVFIDVANAAASGGSDLELFAEVAGESAADFKAAFEDDAAGAILSFIEGLDEMSQSGGNVFAVLDELGLSEIRVRDALLRAAGAGDLFTEALELGSEAWAENIALTKEAEARYATTESRLRVAANQISNVGRTVGDVGAAGLIVLTEAIEPLTARLQGLADEFGRTWNPARVEQFADAVGDRIGDLRGAFEGLEGVAAGAGVAIASSFASGLPFIGQAIPQIGLLTGVLAGVVVQSDEARGAFAGLGETLVDIGRDAGPVALAGIRAFAEGAGVGIGHLVDGISEAAEIALPALTRAVADVGPPAGEFLAAAGELAGEVLPDLAAVVAAMAPAISVAGSALGVAADAMEVLADHSDIATAALAVFASVKVMGALKAMPNTLGLISVASRNTSASLIAMRGAASAAAASLAAAAVAAAPYIAIGVGVAALTNHITGNKEAARETKQAIDDYTRAIIEAGNAAEGAADKIEQFYITTDPVRRAVDAAGVGLAEFQAAMSGTDAEAQAMIDSLVAASGATTGLYTESIRLRNTLELERERLLAGAAAAEEVARAKDRDSAATKLQSQDIERNQFLHQKQADAKRRSAEAAEINRAATEAETRAIEEQFNAVQSSLSTSLNLERAQREVGRSVQDATTAYGELLKVQGNSSATQEDLISATRRVEDANAGVSDSLVQAAGLVQRLAEEQAIAAGAPLDAADSFAIFRDELLRLADASPGVRDEVNRILDIMRIAAGDAPGLGEELGAGFTAGPQASLDDMLAALQAVELDQLGLDLAADLGTGTKTGLDGETDGVTAELASMIEAAAGANVVGAQASMVPVGEAMIDGMATGLANSAAAQAAARQAVQRVLDAAKKAALIGSPSRLFADEVGGPIAEGVAVGIEAQTTRARQAAAALVAAVHSEVQATRTQAQANLGVFIGEVDALEARAAQAKRRGAQDADELVRNAETARAAILEIVATAFEAQDEYTTLIRDTAAQIGTGATEIIAALAPTGDALREAAQEAISFARSVRSSLESSFDVVGSFSDAYTAALKAVEQASEDNARAVEEANEKAQKAGDDLRDRYTDAFSSITSSLGAEVARQASLLNLSVEQLSDVATGAERFASAFRSSFESATSVVSAFGGESFVSARGIKRFLDTQLKDAREWAADLKELAGSGIDEGILQELAQAGPKAAPLAAALLDAVAEGGLAGINETQAQLRDLLGETIGSVGASLIPAFAAGEQAGKALSDGIAAQIVGSSAGIQSAIATVIEQTRQQNLALVESTTAATVDIVALFQEQVDAAQAWADQLGALAESGIDQGLLRRIAEAGPEAAPLIQAILSQVAAGNLEVINQAQSDLDVILEGTVDGITAHVAPAIVAGTQIGTAIMDSWVEAIVLGSGAVQSAMAKAVEDAITAAKQAAEISSPSRRFAREIGAPIIEGVALGIEQGAHLVGDAVTAATKPKAISTVEAMRAWSTPVSAYQAAPVAAPGDGGGTIVQLVMPDGKVMQEYYLDPWGVKLLGAPSRALVRSS